ncbi:M56 family metallopeptidase [Clostridium sp.]|jgi:bla regulator protein BlaR1|uniref:M56 family metallopeptidase n=1 Tax=Clostridium sp. TaxID=1506 RepID=UPI003EE845D9
MDILSFFEIILLSSLIGSIIVLMILIIKGIFKNKLSSNFHYYIWLILIIKLIIPIGPQTPLNISNIYKNFYVQSTTNENTEINSSKQLDNSNLDGSKSISSLTPTSESVIDNTINIPLKSKINIKKLFCFIWIFGVLILIGTLVTGHKKLKNIVSSSMKNINRKHKEILYICMKTMNIRTQVELSYSQKISSPSLCGINIPKILIPVSVADNVCDEEFKYIIMHELTHLKNKDIFVNFVITLLSMIYWFNPILLYGFHKMRQDLKISCDAKTISYLDDGKNIQYGNAIVTVLELAGNSNRLMGTTSMVMNSSEIKRMIIMISKHKKANMKNILLGAIIVVILGGIGLALNTSKSQAETQVETSVKVAGEVVRNIYNVSGERIAEIQTHPEPDGDPGSEEYNKKQEDAVFEI